MIVRLWTAVLLAAAAVSLPASAHAQSRRLEFEPAAAGACTIVVKLPESGAVIDRVTVDGGDLDLTRVSRMGDLDVGIPLSGPLRQGDALQVTLRSSAPNPPTAMATVGPGVSGNITCGAALASQHPPDDREVFEIAGFLGLAIDNFAPKGINGYPDSAASTRNRRTFGAIGQYRLWGEPGDDRQLWLAGATLNGLRTADIDCTDPGQLALCRDGRPDTSVKLPTDIQSASIQVLEHATTLEAHVDLRFEFWTLQRNSPNPAKVFGFYRYGFVDIIDPVVSCAPSTSTSAGVIASVNSACTVTVNQSGSTMTTSLAGSQPSAFSTNYFGIGALLPAGQFRDSGLMFGLAKEDIYGTSRGKWSRVKLNAIGIFDVMPQLGDTNVGRWLGFGSWRFFVALDADRDSGGHGPDSIQTYIGFAFDLGKAFHL